MITLRSITFKHLATKQLIKGLTYIRFYDILILE